MNHLLHRFLENAPHALLLVGDIAITKEAALDFAVKELFPNAEKKLPHPDIHQYMPEGKTGMHGIASLRNLFQEVILTPFDGEKKCFIIHQAERMLPTSSHALLKIIEEPPPKTLFILLTTHKERMLPTLLSRCQIVYFPEYVEKERTPLQEAFLEVLAGRGSLDEVVKSLEGKKKEREKNLNAFLQDLTPQQKENVEKEIEGESTLRFQEDINSLFAMILTWHRDLHALASNAPLLLAEKITPFKGKKHPPLSLVEKGIKEGKLALERNINIKTILEVLLFRLGH